MENSAFRRFGVDSLELTASFIAATVAISWTLYETSFDRSAMTLALIVAALQKFAYALGEGCACTSGDADCCFWGRCNRWIQRWMLHPQERFVNGLGDFVTPRKLYLRFTGTGENEGEEAKSEVFESVTLSDKECVYCKDIPQPSDDEEDAVLGADTRKTRFLAVRGGKEFSVDFRLETTGKWIGFSDVQTIRLSEELRKVFDITTDDLWRPEDRLIEKIRSVQERFIENAHKLHVFCAPPSRSRPVFQVIVAVWAMFALVGTPTVLSLYLTPWAALRGLSVELCAMFFPVVLIFALNFAKVCYPEWRKMSSIPSRVLLVVFAASYVFAAYRSGIIARSCPVGYKNVATIDAGSFCVIIDGTEAPGAAAFVEVLHMGPEVVKKTSENLHEAAKNDETGFVHIASSVFDSVFRQKARQSGPGLPHPVDASAIGLPEPVNARSVAPAPEITTVFFRLASIFSPRPVFNGLDTVHVDDQKPLSEFIEEVSLLPEDEICRLPAVEASLAFESPVPEPLPEPEPESEPEFKTKAKKWAEDIASFISTGIAATAKAVAALLGVGMFVKSVALCLAK